MKLQKRLVNMVNDISLNKKFFLIYVLCVLIPIITTSFFFLNTVGGYVEDRENENRKISLDRATSEIQDILGAGIDISQSISLDRSLYELLDRDYVSDVDYYNHFFNFMRDRINMYMIVYKMIEDVSIYTSNPKVISGGNYFYIDQEVMNAEWYQRIDEIDADMFVYSYNKPDWINPRKVVPAVSIIKKLNRYVVYSQNKGILKLDIDINSIYDIMKREKQYMNLFLVDNLGRVICSTDKQYEKDITRYEMFENIVFDEQEEVISRIFGNPVLQGWRVIGVLDKSVLNRELNAARGSVLILMLVTTLLSTLLVVILLRSYNYRVMSLTKHMRKVKGQQFDHLKPIEISEGKDEIGELIRSFNHMTEKINALIHDVYVLELQKKSVDLEKAHAELNFLQSQMNPHFLFNTLNAILVICAKNNYTDIVDIIKYLSKILRRLLSWKEDMISIQEEIAFTEMYLKIEKFRFGDQFEYQFFIDERIQTYSIPKMSIQTLVENACKHGLQAVKGSRMVTITTALDEAYMTIAIKDNGQGMDANTLEDIMEHIKDEQASSHIGVRNVYRRLKLNYGEEVEFHIESRRNEGTEVSFKIPIVCSGQLQRGEENVQSIVGG